MPEGEKPKVRGRGSAKFGSAFGGSGLLAWTSEDVNSAPSELALNPRRSSRSRSPREKARLAKRNKMLDGPLEPDREKRKWDGPRRKREPRSKWVKVTGIPKVAKAQHVRHLFSSSKSKVLECIMDGPIAYLSFERFEDAAAAIKQYDGGDINGDKLSMELEFNPPKGEGASGEAKEPQAEAAKEGAEAAAEDGADEDSQEGSSDSEASEEVAPGERRVIKLDDV
mmetsp:Transcript_7450/g.16463  ORF Transcript_7450/g.16463 Transcript_7450/m.16463 type:complete len:225 (-) Transcript_7450:118-792(-)|eukprot:CAMPEP_0178458898 /NCGR_PEP_ID=MMETSP0689_2-20121128/47802_1 /TAXON_ID=160604 /ORGANISM="Amphidinium massartii, Strain CS-259" /LENGTH=224 /DNA_ID=CAMNT_0020085259 /DNA_START=122 /DNA_END=796 /DNA_ORIENTATION=+